MSDYIYQDFRPATQRIIRINMKTSQIKLAYATIKFCTKCWKELFIVSCQPVSNTHVNMSSTKAEGNSYSWRLLARLHTCTHITSSDIPNSNSKQVCTSTKHVCLKCFVCFQTDHQRLWEYRLWIQVQNCEWGQHNRRILV